MPGVVPPAGDSATVALAPPIPDSALAEAPDESSTVDVPLISGESIAPPDPRLDAPTWFLLHLAATPGQGDGMAEGSMTQAASDLIAETVADLAPAADPDAAAADAQETVKTVSDMAENGTDVAPLVPMDGLFSPLLAGLGDVTAWPGAERGPAEPPVDEALRIFSGRNAAFAPPSALPVSQDEAAAPSPDRLPEAAPRAAEAAQDVSAPPSARVSGAVAAAPSPPTVAAAHALVPGGQDAPEAPALPPHALTEATSSADEPTSAGRPSTSHSASPQSAPTEGPASGNAQPASAAGPGSDAALGMDVAAAPQPGSPAVSAPIPDAALTDPSDPAQAPRNPLRETVLVEVARHGARPTDGPVTVTLSPADLGTLRFEILQNADSLHLHLVVDEPGTLELLRRHGDQLISDLRQSGFANASLSFDGQGAKSGSDGRGEGARYAPPAQRADSGDGLFAPPPPPAPGSSPSGSALNLRL